MSRTSPPKPPWKIDPSIDIDRISADDIKLIFTQAEKRLDETIKTGEMIAGRTMTLMTLLIGVLLAMSGFLISNWKGWSELNTKVFVSLVGSIYSMAVVSYMLKNILPNNYRALGSSPRELMSPVFYEATIFSTDRVVIFMYISEVENYDARIEHNRIKNNERWRRYHHALIALWIMPLILGILYMGFNK